MKVWLDAKREPDPDWVWCKAECSAIAMLKGGNVEYISFAPDQRKLVAAVTDWMIENDVHPERREIHKRTDGVKSPRGVLQMINRAAAL